VDVACRLYSGKYPLLRFSAHDVLLLRPTVAPTVVGRDHRPQTSIGSVPLSRGTGERSEPGGCLVGLRISGFGLRTFDF
jgi:hypothetical protein